jgi:hypothetical protein
MLREEIWQEIRVHRAIGMAPNHLLPQIVGLRVDACNAEFMGRGVSNYMRSLGYEMTSVIAGQKNNIYYPDARKLAADNRAYEAIATSAREREPNWDHKVDTFIKKWAGMIPDASLMDALTICIWTLRKVAKITERKVSYRQQLEDGGNFKLITSYELPGDSDESIRRLRYANGVMQEIIGERDGSNLS